MPLGAITPGEPAAYTALAGQINMLLSRAFLQDSVHGVDASLRSRTFRGLGAPNPADLMKNAPQLVNVASVSSGSTTFSVVSGLPAADNLRPDVSPNSSLDDIGKLVVWSKEVLRMFKGIMAQYGITVSSINLNAITPGVDVGATLIAIAAAFNNMVTIWNANTLVLQRLPGAATPPADANFPSLPPLIVYA